jgi:hypothetical protein
VRFDDVFIPSTAAGRNKVEPPSGSEIEGVVEGDGESAEVGFERAPSDCDISVEAAMARAGVGAAAGANMGLVPLAVAPETAAGEPKAAATVAATGAEAGAAAGEAVPKLVAAGVGASAEERAGAG